MATAYAAPREASGRGETDAFASSALGELPEGLAGDVTGVGGTLVARPAADRLAELIQAQRLAVVIAESKGYDPDHPRNLSRSVILTP
ncbi:hypothetical protein ACPXCE_15875 [Streptomyces sp. DT24]|uniref:hypothetical protein n=1 Tax=Streptomyces sp. DT24 TaxID=3416520 RepID=UPI003CE9421F